MANPCSLCPAHCCKSYTITVTAFDVLRLKRSGRDPRDFAVLHQARLLSYDPDTTLEMEDESWVYLLGFRSHPCVFLGKDNLCTVHAQAPMSCRRYPYQLDGKLNTRFCPFPSQLLFRVKGPDIPTDPLVRELEAYKRIVKGWNGKPGKLADCMGALLSRAEEMVAGGEITL